MNIRLALLSSFLSEDSVLPETSDTLHPTCESLVIFFPTHVAPFFHNTVTTLFSIYAAVHILVIVALLAQSEEHQPSKLRVAGSSPA